MKTIDLQVPASWEELTPEQILFVAGLHNKGLTRTDFLTYALLKLAGIGVSRYVTDDERFWFRKDGLTFPIKADDFREFAEKLAFLADSPGLMQAPGIKGYAAPDYRLYEVTLEEYLTADFMYIGASRCGEKDRRDMLCRFMAVMWRKSGEPFADELPERRYKKFRETGKIVQTAVFLWWTGLKTWLREQYPRVFTGGDSESSPKEIVFGLLSAFNDGKPQDNERILKTKVHEVFWELERRIEAAEKVK